MAITWTFSKHKDGSFSWDSAIDNDPSTVKDSRRAFVTLGEAVSDALLHGLTSHDAMEFSISIFPTDGD